MTKAKSRKSGKNSGKRAETKAPKRSERTGAPKHRRTLILGSDLDEWLRSLPRAQ
jgi:hypothetical protein